MRKYLIFFLISISTCIRQMVLDESKLIDIKSISTVKREDIYFTLCLEMIRSDEYKEILKEFESEIPDDVTDIEVGMEACNKLSTYEPFIELLDALEENKNDIKKIYSFQSNLQVNKQMLLLDRSDKLIELEMEDRIVLKKLFSNFSWKNLFRAICIVAVAICPASAPIVGAIELGLELLW